MSVDKFIHFVNERQRIFTCKNNGLKRPWTDDPILDKHHFCNVHREDDRGTKELKALQLHLNIPDTELPAYWTAARMFNHAPSTEVYWEQGVGALKMLQENGVKIFNTAYVVSTCGKSMNKVDYVNQVVEAVAYKPISPLSCRAAFRDLRTVDGLGSFMCGQIIADLKYTPYLEAAPDWATFAVMGPGSKKGLDILFGPNTTESNFMARLTLLRFRVEPHIPQVHNQDLQNCLCEFQKWHRYSNNLPGRRRYY